MLVFEPLWSLSFSDLRRLPRAQRRAVVRRIVAPERRWQRSVLFWIGAGFVLPAATVIAASLWGLALLVGAGVLGVVLLYPLDVWWGAVQAFSQTRVRLRREMAEEGYPLCLTCGYDLRGATGARCSECGRPLPLRRFRVRVELGGGAPAQTWSVTAISAAHARAVAEQALVQRGLRGGVGAAEQIVREPAARCGEVSVDET